MTRFKTKIFDDFSGGEQCDILDPAGNSFLASENLVIEKNKIKLGPDVKNDVPYDSGLIGWTSQKLSFIYLASVYIFSTDESDCIIKKCLYTTGAITTVATLADSHGSIPKCFIKFRSLAIVSFKNNAGDAYLCKYSTDGMTMSTWSNTNLIAKIGSHYILDYIIIHDRLYILTENDRILYSDDGITFESLVTLDPEYVYKSFQYLDGYFYLVNNTKKSTRGIIRISLSGEIQDEIVSFSSIYSFSLQVFAGKLYLLADSTYLYRIDGGIPVPIFKFDGCDMAIVNDSVKELLFFEVGNGRILSMDINEKFTSPYKNFNVPIALHSYDEDFTFIVYFYGSDTAQFAIYNNTEYVSPGSVETSKFRIKGSFVPVQATILHDPLTANAWVKVYVKKDGASSWGSAVIDSNATNAVSKSYDFPTGDELRTIEFKIEYGTADDSETPEDAKLEFVYLPIELANSE